jgi:hypothetical protein
VLLHYGQFHLNLAAALEDAIIRAVDPEWNGGPAETEVSLPGPQATESPAPIVGTFSFTLQPSYYRTGFFNVGVSAQKFLGADGETIELFLGNGVQPILGSINRRANMNGTPRVMGGAGLRDWFNTECLRDGPRFGCGVVTNCHPPARASEAYRFGQLDRLFQALDVSDSRAERRLRRRKLSRQWQDRRGSTTAPRSSRMQTFAATSAVCKSISFRSARSGLTANSLRADVRSYRAPGGINQA